MPLPPSFPLSPYAFCFAVELFTENTSGSWFYVFHIFLFLISFYFSAFWTRKSGFWLFFATKFQNPLNSSKMACSLKIGLSVSASNDTILGSQTKRVLRLRPSRASLRFTQTYSKDFMAKPVRLTDRNAKRYTKFSVSAQPSICVSRALRWWEKTPKPNMVEINSAQELVDFLSNAGDRLVIVDFYSPGCGGCRTLHPKICQLAELNPNAVFLKVNREELNKMCDCLHIKVLPFFRFYRGSEGKLCSFSCTIATIKKFKDALAKYGIERCNPGPAKGLDESELLRLASAGEISIKSSLSSTKEDGMEDLVLKDLYLPGLYAKTGNNKVEIGEEKAAALLV